MSRAPRNYKREYQQYHGKPARVAERSTRNKARRKLGLTKGDPREVDHKIPLSRGGSNARSNLRAVSLQANRRKFTKSAAVDFSERSRKEQLGLGAAGLGAGLGAIIQHANPHLNVGSRLYDKVKDPDTLDSDVNITEDQVQTLNKQMSPSTKIYTFDEMKNMAKDPKNPSRRITDAQLDTYLKQQGQYHTERDTVVAHRGKKGGSRRGHILAHELGHAKLHNKPVIGKIMKVAPAISSMGLSLGAPATVLAGTEEGTLENRIGNIAQYGGVAATTPRLIDEGYANIEGYRNLKRLGLSPEDLGKSRKSLTYGMGSYVANAVPTMAAPFLLRKARRKYDERERKRNSTKTASLLQQSAADRERLQPLIDSESKRLSGLGLNPLLSGSVARRVNLPGESDIDFAVGTDNIDETSSLLERSGIPFAKMKGNNRLHQYTTDSGTPIDVQVRPTKEVDFLRAGTENMAKLPESEIEKILIEKDRLKRSGDKDAYKKYKYGIYERHGVFPKGGDWSKLADDRERTYGEMRDAIRGFAAKQNIDPEKAMLVAGGAGYMHGMRDEVNDLDFFHDDLPDFVQEPYGRFDMDGGPGKDLPEAAKQYQMMHGMRVQTPEAMLAFYQRLNRPKDQEKIKMLQAHLKTASNVLIKGPPSEKERLSELREIMDQRKKYVPNKKLDKQLDKVTTSFSKLLDLPVAEIKRELARIASIILFHKKHFNLERPHVLAKRHGIPFDHDYDKVPSAHTPSYPSGHTCQSHYLYLVYSDIFPNMKSKLKKLAQRIADARIDRGLHYPSDNEAGVELAEKLYKIREGNVKTASTATKTNPGLWEKSKQQAKDRMGGKHSARAMQLATKIYKSKGGGYSGAKPSSKTNSLKKWSKQDWGYSGKDKPGQGGSGVYLPKAKRDRLKSTKAGRKQLASATRKKHKATAQGKQYSSHGLAAGTSLKKEAHMCRKDILKAFKEEGGALDMKALLKHTKGKQPEAEVRKELKKLKREGVVKDHKHGDMYTTKTASNCVPKKKKKGLKKTAQIMQFFNKEVMTAYPGEYEKEAAGIKKTLRRYKSILKNQGPEAAEQYRSGALLPKIEESMSRVQNIDPTKRVEVPLGEGRSMVRGLPGQEAFQSPIAQARQNASIHRELVKNPTLTREQFGDHVGPLLAAEHLGRGTAHPSNILGLMMKKAEAGGKKDPRLTRAGVSGYNQVKRTPGHPTKSHIVVAKEGDRIKTIRFGQQGVKTNQTAGQREAFKSRHAKNIARGKMSAAYWADKAKWSAKNTADKDNKKWVKGS